MVSKLSQILSSKEGKARVAVIMILSIALTIYFVVNVLQVVDSQRRPYIAQMKLKDEPFPVPGVLFCGFCSKAGDTSSCPTISCKQGDLSATATDCSSLLTSVDPTSVKFRNYPNLVTQSLNAVRGNCLFFHPPSDRLFQHDDTRSDKLYLFYTPSGNESADRPSELVFGVFDNTEDPLNVEPVFSGFDKGTHYVYLTRQKYVPLSGDPWFQLNRRVVSAQKQANIFSIEVSVENYDLLVLSEQPRFNWWNLFGNVGGAFSILGFVYLFLFGMNRVDPWGFVQRYVIKTSPRSVCQSNELPKSIADVNEENSKFLENLSMDGSTKKDSLPRSFTLRSSSSTFHDDMTNLPAISVLHRRLIALERALNDYYCVDISSALVVKLLEVYGHQNAKQFRRSSAEACNVDLEKCDGGDDRIDVAMRERLCMQQRRSKTDVADVCASTGMFGGGTRDNTEMERARSDLSQHAYPLPQHQYAVRNPDQAPQEYTPIIRNPSLPPHPSLPRTDDSGRGESMSETSRTTPPRYMPYTSPPRCPQSPESRAMGNYGYDLDGSRVQTGNHTPRQVIRDGDHTPRQVLREREGRRDEWRQDSGWRGQPEEVEGFSD